MSKKEIKKRKYRVVRCEGCNHLVHPRRIMLVDPKQINIDRKPLYLCGRCRLRLVWRKVEDNGKV